MNKQKIAIAVLIGAVTIGFGFWRWKVGGKTHPAHGVELWDRSESMATGCDCVVAAARRGLQSPYFGRGSTLTFTATGDASSASEPIMIATYEAPVNRRALEGRSAVLDRREELLDDLRKKCENVGRTKTSPIYLAIKRAVEQLRAAGCDGNSNCFVFALTDLEENANLQIKRALDGGSSLNQASPALINNDGIDIVISGIAETVGVAKGSDGVTRHLTNNRDQQRADRIVEVWRKLFTSPDRVTFQPYCPKGLL
jgi:hypothetical protein